MSVNPPNPGAFQGQISQYVVAIRNDFQNLANQFNYIVAQGGTEWLTSYLGLTAPDAATTMAALGNLNNLNAVYNGGALPAQPLNYNANSEPLWGGQ